MGLRRDYYSCPALLILLSMSNANNNIQPVAAAYSNSSSNQLHGVQSLRNHFFALRHGQSEANVAGIIASDPAIASTKYGLSELGQQQARAAAQSIVQFYQQQQAYEGIAVISSDLLRAKETAECVVEAVTHRKADATAGTIPLYTNSVVLDPRLRERGFGEWDGGSDAHYEQVWKDDALDSSHTNRGVEAVDSVTQRATACVLELDQKLNNHMIVLTAHGDVLQILQTAFLRWPGTRHRTVKHLETATLRALELR